MSSTGDERSLASGIPIPQWMRTKTENYGFDPSTLSPPMHEGDFFYIKFPRPPSTEQATHKNLSEVLEMKEKALNQHTESCKQFIPQVQDTVQIQKPKIVKPMGIDDGFKGQGAACGASVVEVAHQILAGKNKSFKPLMRGDTEGSLAPPSSYLQKRRDSKSLPASPIASPESSPLTRRKHISGLQNKGLFGGSFLVNPDNLSESDEQIDKKSGSSWILSSLFSTREKKDNEKEPVNEKSVVAVDPNSEKLVKQIESTAEGISQPVNVAVEIKAISPGPTSQNKSTFLKSKSNFRDLNLLTPSSM